jgi:hydrogenase maturation protease
MRGDDGVGCHVAQMLENCYCHDPNVRVMGAHQLTPEMAEDISASEFVLFLDAAVGERAGVIKHARVKPRQGPLSFAHFLDPEVLLAAAVELYGSVPQAELLTIVGASFEIVNGISAEVAPQLPQLFEKARTIVEFRRHEISGAARDSSRLDDVPHPPCLAE